MKKIGITGGIGSGKSIICEVFRVLGVSVFHADMIARTLQETDQVIRRELTNLFGKSIYLEDGKLDRKKLAEFIFTYETLKNKVSQLVHPVVRERFLKWVEKHSGEPYVLFEAAILFETGSYHNFDYNILVIADEKTRIKRVMQRDSLSDEAVLDRIKNQKPDQEKIPLADFILYNDEEHLLLPQILKLDKFFRGDGKIR